MLRACGKSLTWRKCGRTALSRRALLCDNYSRHPCWSTQRPAETERSITLPRGLPASVRNDLQYGSHNDHGLSCWKDGHDRSPLAPSNNNDAFWFLLNSRVEPRICQCMETAAVQFECRTLSGRTGNRAIFRYTDSWTRGVSQSSWPGRHDLLMWWTPTFELAQNTSTSRV